MEAVLLSPGMAFEGWRGDFVGFFRGLELDNSKAYFDSHRELYEEAVRGPLLALLAELEPELGATRMFRINRDIRFSRDKSPYKTNVAGHAGELYVHLDRRQLFVGAGNHHPEPAWLRAFRTAVAGPAGAELGRIVEAARAQGFTAGGDPLSTAPKGFPPEHERIEILRWRNVVLGRRWEIGPWIATREARERVVDAWGYLEPFAGWLGRHVAAA